MTKRGKPSLKENLIDAGVNVMFRLGYHGASVRDIASAASAPLGSFTNHFESKEAFAGEVLNRYFANVKQIMESTLGNHELTPRDRLQRYLEVITGRLESGEWARGCLIGNFSLETPMHSEELRNRLSTIFTEWREPFTACIAEGQAKGELSGEFTPEDLADYLLAGWQGAMLRMKVERSPEPIERFKKITFATVFKKINE